MAGAPRKYKSVKELQEKIDDYFDSCWIDKITEVTDKDGNVTSSNVKYQHRPYTVTGLALHLGLTRQGLLNYQGRPAFVDTVTRAKLKCEMYAEESLYTSRNANGVAFALKNNFGWKEKQEHEHTGNPEEPLIIKFVKANGEVIDG